MQRPLLRRAADSGLLLALLAPTALCADLFVDASLTTGANNGSTWADAFQGTDGLVAALGAAAPGDRIFVAQGTYRPSATGDRSASLHVSVQQLEIYGGCLGVESAPEERPELGSAPTILTGDLGNNDPAMISDNSHHVVQVTAGPALLDRLTVRGGYANESSGVNGSSGAGLLATDVSIAVRDCVFEENLATGQGGGALVRLSPFQLNVVSFTGCRFTTNSAGALGGGLAVIGTNASTTVDRSLFVDNFSGSNGGGLYSGGGSTRVTNSIFQENQAFDDGGGVSFAFGGSGSTHVVSGCTVVANRSTVGSGGGISRSFFGTGTPTTVENCIVWGNQGPGSTRTFQSQVSDPGATLRYSIVEGIQAGPGNLDVDPQLMDVAAGDLRPTLASPAIDAGDNSAVIPPSSGLAVDFDGFRRFQDEPSVPDTGLGSAPVVDIGAHEYTTFIGKPYCTTLPNSSGLPGRLDATGSTAVADNDVTLVATQLPAGVLGYFLTSRTPGFVPGAGGASGNLCLGGAVGRFNGPSQVLNTGPVGEASFTLDLAAHPTPTGAVSVVVGETWRFQMWFRDSVLGFATSNLSEAVAITFE